MSQEIARPRRGGHSQLTAKKRGKRMRRTLAVSLGTAAALAAFMPAGQASADGRVHVVKPGRSIQKAVDRARPGDVTLLKAGRYDGRGLVRKPLTIRRARNTPVPPPRRPADHRE